jgi:hypothetical protein
MPNLLGHNILTLYRYCTTKLCNFTNSVVPSSAVMFVGLNKLSLYTNNNCYKLRNNNTDLYRTIDLSHFFHLVRNQGYRIFIANCQKSNTFSTICFVEFTAVLRNDVGRWRIKALSNNQTWHIYHAQKQNSIIIIAIQTYKQLIKTMYMLTISTFLGLV